MTNPRLVTEMVRKFNMERCDDDNAGDLCISTYDIKDFFTNVDRAVFESDIKDARDGIHARLPGANFF